VSIQLISPCLGLSISTKQSIKLSSYSTKPERIEKKTFACPKQYNYLHDTIMALEHKINLWQPIVRCTMYIHLREFSKIIGNV
jgi:hypothetical protein